jgi:DNA (cytosine-5)-methyltransferase 1
VNHLDLFSGIGGFALAARWAGIETVAFCEIDPFCRQVLKKHWPGVLKYMDIRDVKDPGHVDILTAGFPCQPFSVAGKKKGISDDRYLWPETFRIITVSKPDWVILENVPGIIPMLDPILEDLEREGYDWQAYLIPAVAIGAPHKRERLWIVANASSERLQGKRKPQQSLYTEKDCQRKAGHAIDDINNSQYRYSNIVSDSSRIAGVQTNPSHDTSGSQWETWLMHCRESWKFISRTYWEENQPPIPGVDDGLPNGMDRNKSLGNAIVPQIAYMLMKIIKATYD